MYGNLKDAYFSVRNPFPSCSISMVGLGINITDGRGLSNERWAWP